MRRPVIVLTALAVIAFSGAALAGANKPVQMTDEQMDQVTAGTVGQGIVTGFDAGAQGGGIGRGLGTARLTPAGDNRVPLGAGTGTGCSNLGVSCGQNTLPPVSGH